MTMLALVLALVFVVGAVLVFPLPRGQQIDIAIMNEGVPVSYMRVRLVSYPTLSGCLSGTEGVTDEYGRFHATRRQWLSALTEMTVDRLCVEQNGRWDVIWQLPYGPVPRKLVMWCDLSGAPRGMREAPSATVSLQVCRLGQKEAMTREKR